MPRNNDRFKTRNGKKLILVVEDEVINREMLKVILEDDYDILFAEDGLKALDIIEENKEVLSVILLDLMIPGIDGKHLLVRIKDDASTVNIPVIVMTADQKSEVECLDLGAVDFIPKPYPAKPVILARIRRTIELNEDRQIIKVTERDNLTGLYNRDYFLQYCQQHDKLHPEKAMDAIIVDINHFRMINERYGKAYGDEVLINVGEQLRQYINEKGGIVCRRNGDIFLAYCPHLEDYETIAENASIKLGNDSENRIRVRMGIYPDVDKSVDIERRFDRAKLASDTIRNSFNKKTAVYDKQMYEKEMYEVQLIESFPKAVKDEQFVVYYQPKFNIQGERSVLASAEALVRWSHPELGMISPGDFIPLFETNGLILHLDRYVWTMVAKQLRAWKDKYGFTIPVSVNVSRVDMFDPELLESFRQLLAEYQLTTSEFLLEITESAYTQDSNQIITKVSELRDMGFKIEMDDFGTGYSSLNMISTLPIDALKIDMRFIRDAFKENKDTRIIEVIIDIADYLKVPVIAEGVETEQQLSSLKEMGCDIVQGYYFSKAIPAEEFARFIEEEIKLRNA